jgi:hypothetical protein
MVRASWQFGVAMTMTNHNSGLPKFPHRHNPDGTIDSICAKCFVTVATSRKESELEEAEKTHDCDPFRLAAFHLGPEDIFY